MYSTLADLVSSAEGSLLPSTVAADTSLSDRKQIQSLRIVDTCILLAHGQKSFGVLAFSFNFQW